MARKALRADDVKAMRWVVPRRGSGTRAILEAALAALGTRTERPRRRAELPSNEAVQQRASKPAPAPTALSRLVVQDAIAAGALAALNFKLPKRLSLGVAAQGPPPTRAERALLALIDDHAAGRPPHASAEASRAPLRIRPA